MPWVAKFKSDETWAATRNILPANETADETLKGWNAEMRTVESPKAGNNWRPNGSRHQSISNMIENKAVASMGNGGRIALILIQNDELEITRTH